MFINKILQHTVLLTDPNDLLMDQQTKIMDVLKQTFEGKCFRSCLIKEIVKIHRMGHLIFIRSRQDSTAKCDVQFEVKALEYKQHQILHECIISKKAENGTIICSNDDAAVLISANKILQGFRKGDKIIVRAGMFRYKISRNKISVKGYPFLPVISKVGVIYGITPRDSKFIQELLAELAQARTECRKLAEFKTYQKLLYPCGKSKQVYEKKFSEFKAVPIRDVFKQKKIYVCLPSHVDLTDEKILINPKVNTKVIIGKKTVWARDSNFIIDDQDDSEKILGQMIHSMIEYYREIASFCKLYGSNPGAKNKYQFSIYEKAKK